MEFPVYEDDYEGEEEFPDYEEGLFEQDFETAALSFHDLWSSCISSILQDTYPNLLTSLAYCFGFTVIVQLLPNGIPRRKFLLNLVSFCLGTKLVTQQFGVESWTLFLYAAWSYILLWCTSRHENSSKYQGILVSLSSITYVVCYEFLIPPSVVHKVRGAQMILLMKVISLSTENGSQMTILEYLGYCFHAGNVLFGPWIPFSVYCEMLARKKTYVEIFASIYRVSLSALLSIFCLLFTTCLIPWFPLRRLGKWTAAYQDAASFRFSHYFISFWSEATAMAAGMQDMKVSYPFKLELPRSLVEVVIYWNIPMRDWLKEHVFSRIRPLTSVPVAVTVTYCASALLHGLNFQLASVLLSLALFTLVEHNLRLKLARIFDACIEPRKCRKCSHSVQPNSYAVILTNLGFSAISIAQLAYLGVMFDSSSQQEEGYGYLHTLEKWSDLNFAGHWIAAGAAVISYLI